MNLNKILKWVALVGIFTIPFIPLLVTPSMFFPFITGKNFAFRIITEIVFFAWIALAFLDPLYRPKFSLVLASLGGFVGVIALADVFGENPIKSIWSNFERMEGLVSLLHLFAYFIATASILSTRRLWDRFFKTSVGVSIIVGGYGLLQLAGVLETHQGSRLDATLGNASYLAIYMLFHIFILGLLMVRHEGSKWMKWFYGLMIFMELAVLYHTATRGTILGLMGALVIMSLLVALFGKEYPRARKITAGILVGIVVVVGGFFAAKDTDFVRTSPVLSRFASISLEERTTQSRFIIWGMSIEAFKEKPILGWGQENFNIAFNKYYKPALWQQETWFDRAHNIFFDWLIAGGLLGILGYLSIFGTVLYYTWRREENSFSLIEKSIMTGLLAGYFFHNLFVFDNIISYIMFFSVVAYMHSINAKQGEGQPKQFSQSINMTALSVIAILLITSVYFINIKSIRSSQSLLQALSPQEEGLEKNLEFYNKALASGFVGKQEIREQLLQAAGQVAGLDVPDDLKRQFVGLAEGEMRKQIEEAPNDARTELFFSTFLSAFGQQDEAIVHGERALELSPDKQAIRFALANVYINKKDFQEATDILRETFLLDQTYPEARTAYATALVYNNQFKEAEELLLEGFGTLVIDNNLLLNAYAEKGRYDLVAGIWEKKVEKNPDNAQFKLSLAASYINIGQRQKAIDEIQKIIDSNPEFKEQGEYYINEIKAGRNP